MKNTIRAALVILSLGCSFLIGCGGEPDQAPTPEEATAVTGALANTGGSLGWYCSDDGTCTCSGGTLSSDCWGLSQYCIDNFQCRVSPPYLCYCHWTTLRQTAGGKVVTGAVGSTAITKSLSR